MMMVILVNDVVHDRKYLNVLNFDVELHMLMNTDNFPLVVDCHWLVNENTHLQKTRFIIRNNGNEGFILLVGSVDRSRLICR